MLADVYQVVCPKCGWNHFKKLEGVQDTSREIEVVCPECEPIDESKGRYGY